MKDFTAELWQVRLQNLHMVSSLEGLIVIWKNVWARQAVVCSQNTSVPSDPHDDVFGVEACGEAGQDEVCLHFGLLCKHKHLRWSWKQEMENCVTTCGNCNTD